MYHAQEDKSWSEWSYLCFLRVYPGIEGKRLEEKIERMADTVLGEGNPTSAVRTFGLTSMKDVYFSPDIQTVLKSTGHGNRELTWCLLLVGVLIIVVAYINFINFSTALAPARIGTLNICKITGASVFNLRFNVILEAVLLSVGAWLIALVWVYVFSVTDLAKTYFSCSLNPFENILLYVSLGGCSVLFGILVRILSGLLYDNIPAGCGFERQVRTEPTREKITERVIDFSIFRHHYINCGSQFHYASTELPDSLFLGIFQRKCCLCSDKQDD